MKQIPAGISVLHGEYSVEEDDTHIGDGRDSDEYPVEEDDTHIRDCSDSDEYPVGEDDTHIYGMAVTRMIGVRGELLRLGLALHLGGSIRLLILIIYRCKYHLSSTM